MADIWTARVSYRGTDRMDITRKGGSPFGPSWPLLKRYLDIRRAGQETEQTWADYRAAYLDEMRAQWRLDWRPFVDLAYDGGTLVCYCSGQHCHRFLLADIPVNLGAVYRGER